MTALVLAFVWFIPIALGFIACGEAHKLVRLRYEAKAYRNVLEGK